MLRIVYATMRKVLRRGYSLLAQPIVRHLYLNRTTDTVVRGISLVIPPGIFHPGVFRSSRILWDTLSGLNIAGRDLLDMGTGSGVVGILAEKAGARVMVVDINPRAVSCAAENAARNGCRNLTAVESDLFEGIPPGESFDIIAWNPPYYPRDPVGIDALAWYAGEGFRSIETFAARAVHHATPGGRVLLVLSSDLDLPVIFSLFRAEGWGACVLHVRRGVFEDHIVVGFSGIQGNGRMQEVNSAVVQ